VFAGLMAKDGEDRQFTQVLYQWLPVGSLHVDVGFLVDPLSITMVLFVTGIATLIHVYSIGYMHKDEKFSKFFIYMNLFVFSMLILILGNNLVLTFVGWEGVGACSYFLIAFWFTHEANAVAGKKAFITNRVGDFGFMLGIFLTFSALGTVNYLDISSKATTLATVTATAIALLFFVGAAGKSAQLPLSVWLPDAMAGPTPVSALIHAATMVTAGVYLLCRLAPVLDQSSAALNVIAIVGVITALWAATVACAQHDIKKVLAYSTISQLGFMVLAVGCEAYVPAIFHMITHACFKALLFLGAGSVIHGLGGEQDMRRMGGLRKVMPITAGTFIVGWLAISGIPPFAGFWSKDDVLINAYDKSPLLWVFASVAAVLTAYYMSRLVFLTFFGEPRWNAGHDGEHVHAHESPAIMTVPLVLLAILSTLIGVIDLPFGGLDFLEQFHDPLFGDIGRDLSISGATEVVLIIIATVLAVLGILLAYEAWLLHKVEAERLEPEVLQHGWYINDAYAAFFGGPARVGAQFTSDVVDHEIIDGAVNGVGVLIRDGARQLRKLQSGYVRSYALGIAAGAVLVLAWFFSRVNV
ncbi:MAG TPA: NADH-quinone oxidoreductase subunit L, partial [Acidimicrobiales bacterium]|nr:NADH-quinone oxidoreductase subunit L [Acidimicrobiales bacterium]